MFVTNTIINIFREDHEVQFKQQRQYYGSTGITAGIVLIIKAVIRNPRQHNFKGKHLKLKDIREMGE